MRIYIQLFLFSTGIIYLISELSVTTGEGSDFQDKERILTLSSAPEFPVHAQAIKQQIDHKHHDHHHIRPNYFSNIEFSVEDIPESPFKDSLLKLAPDAQNKALKKLSKFSFHSSDLNDMHALASGDIYYACVRKPHSAFNDRRAKLSNLLENANTSSRAKLSKAGDIFVSNVPSYSSKPGSSNTIYLDFNGGPIQGTTWNNDPTLGNISRWDCYPYSTDANFSSFSTSEQNDIRLIWEMVAEDYAPFDVNVTTVEPSSWGDRALHCMITLNYDENSQWLPAGFDAAGIANIGIFNQGNDTRDNSPAFAYILFFDNSNNAYLYFPSEIADTVSHEIGHNFSLTHDGTRSQGDNSYYDGHSNPVSWAPIMGLGWQNVTQWSKGEYYNSNNTQDDVAILANQLGYIDDDHGNSDGSASSLNINNSTVSDTGLITTQNDDDYFEFSAGAGNLSISASTYKHLDSVNFWGSNLDINLTLKNSSGSTLTISNPSSDVNATLNYNITQNGTYYLVVSSGSVGNPNSSSTTGWTAYGSIGTYSLSGTIPEISVIPNEPPQIINFSPPDSVTVNELWSYQVQVSDPDDNNNGNDLSWSLQGEPSGMNISSTGQITWTPTQETTTGTITVTVADGGENGTSPDSEAFSITVTSPYTEWYESYGLNSATGAYNYDADGDGYTNLAEYGLLMDPSKYDDPVIDVNNPGTPYVRLEGNRLIIRYVIDTARHGIRYDAELSTNLTNSTSNGVSTEVVETNGTRQLIDSSITIDETPRFLQVIIRTNN